MRTIFINIFLLGICAMLTGCAQLNSDFDCPIKSGISCKRVDEVNAMVDRGEFRRHSSPALCAPNSGNRGCVKSTSSDMSYPAPYPMSSTNNNDPLRMSEAVARIWIAPYEDTQGNYYQSTIMYRVIKPGHWRGFPTKAITGQED